MNLALNLFQYFLLVIFHDCVELSERENLRILFLNTIGKSQSVKDS